MKPAINSVELPIELWTKALETGRVRNSFLADVQLVDGTTFDKILISERGFLIGRLADGLPGAHGHIDKNILQFRASDIEGISLPKRHFLQKRLWIGSKNISQNKSRYRMPTSTLVTIVIFWIFITLFASLAAIGAYAVYATLKA